MPSSLYNNHINQLKMLKGFAVYDCMTYHISKPQFLRSMDDQGELNYNIYTNGDVVLG